MFFPSCLTQKCELNKGANAREMGWAKMLKKKKNCEKEEVNLPLMSLPFAELIVRIEDGFSGRKTGV